jgi:hypothetical protein
VAGKMPENSALINKRPFRSPHHTISDVALVGGGGVNFTRKCEISEVSAKNKNTYKYKIVNLKSNGKSKKTSACQEN